jgi:branched-chain amino acid aminotransferase
VSIFEGLKGYWHDEDTFGIIELEKHFRRMQNSARLLHIDFDWTLRQFEEAMFELFNALLTPEKDMWVRTTLFATEGNWGLDTKADLVMTAFNQDKAVPSPISMGVSTWQRAADLALPARVKTGSNYVIGRLARIEGRAKGWQEMVLLNRWGRVAEATGSCILMVKDGKLYTTPSYEGALESITVNVVEIIARHLGIDFIRRPIERTELLIADELAICGTLAELVPVESFEGQPIEPNGPVLEAIRNAFFDIVRGKASHPDINITAVPLKLKALNGQLG